MTTTRKPTPRTARSKPAPKPAITPEVGQAEAPVVEAALEALAAELSVQDIEFLDRTWSEQDNPIGYELVREKTKEVATSGAE